MAEKRDVSENHGDYEYHVEDSEDGVVCYRTPLNSPGAPDERVLPEDLPSRSLQDAFQSYTTQRSVSMV